MHIFTHRVSLDSRRGTWEVLPSENEFKARPSISSERLMFLLSWEANPEYTPETFHTLHTCAT